MTPYPKRLIEVDLPIARISAHARAEKESRVGHIPRLHIYPAARPLAACRAVILASLWPDPVDLAEWAKEADAKGEVRAPKGEALKAGEGVVIRPMRFLADATQRMHRWAQVGLHKASPESFKRLVQIQKNPKLLDDAEMLRAVLFDFISDFADWDNSNDKDFLDTARTLVRSAHAALGESNGPVPAAFDPFAGGGAFPVECLRLGMASHASDLNPLAVVLNSVLLEILPAFGDRLSDALDEWLSWASPRAATALSEYFPVHPDGGKPVAYLWSRTVLVSAAGQECPIEVPLLRSMRLTRGRTGGDWALRWAKTKSGDVAVDRFEILTGDGKKLNILRPRLEVIRLNDDSAVGTGTVRRGSVTCPVTGITLAVGKVREQLSTRRGGSADARLYCVVLDLPQTGERVFRAPTVGDQKAIDRAIEVVRKERAIEGVGRFPTEPLPPDGTNGFRVQKYGMRTWGDVFTPRQLLAIACYRDLCLEYVGALAKQDPQLAEAVQTVLALLIDRLADLNASLCVWQLNTPNTAHVFGRWALPMIFDFGEVNPTAGAGGSPESALKRMTSCLRDLTPSLVSTGDVQQADAAHNPLPDDWAAAVFTDPPYYDAIPYGDLMDFFAVWLRRSLPEKRSALFDNGLSPKNAECVVDESKGKTHEYFTRMMTASMSEARRVVCPSGIGVVVFAHKSTAGWEAQLQSLIDAGWVITASWPLDTEMESRLRAKGSAALSSSIHLVCRPKETASGKQTMTTVGDWRDVLDELPKRLESWMPRLTEEGIVGADAIFACLGPALEIFSRYSRVEKASGEAVSLREYLEHVWAAVSNEALTMIFKEADAVGLEPDARLTAMWLWTLGGGKPQASGEGDDGEETESDDEEETTSKKSGKVAGFVLEFDAARKIAQGLGIHLEKSESIVEVKGESARLLPVSERTRHLFGKDAEEDTAKTRKAKKKAKQGSLFEELDAIEAEAASTGGRFGGLEGAKPGATVLDKVHQSMILFAAGRGEALKRFLVEDGVGKDGRFWKLAQSLSALYPTGTDEKRWVDGVLARKKGLGF